jgi:hypothetical protein
VRTGDESEDGTRLSLTAERDAESSLAEEKLISRTRSLPKYVRNALTHGVPRVAAIE